MGNDVFQILCLARPEIIGSAEGSTVVAIHGEFCEESLKHQSLHDVCLAHSRIDGFGRLSGACVFVWGEGYDTLHFCANACLIFLHVGVK